MIIDVQNLNKNYIQGKNRIDVLTNLEFHAQKGESIAIVGASGSGKTTFLSLMAGLDSPSSGRVKMLDTSLYELNEKQLSSFRSKNIGIIYQQFHLMKHLNALENVALPLELQGHKDAYQKAHSLLKEVGLEGRADHLPSQLSGGEQQRVAIARALSIEPQILLADEPSGNLDESTGDKVIQLLFDLVKSHNTTLILVTHNNELAQRCDRVLTLKNGVLN